MSHHPPETPGDQITMAGSYNLVYFLFYAHAMAVLVFLRRNFGREGVGLPGLGTLLMILAWGCMTECFAMFVYLLLWFFALACQAVIRFRNERKGVLTHSRYYGDSFVAKRLFPRVSARNARGVDAFLCFAIGGVFYQFIPPLGAFVMFGFLSVFFIEAIDMQATKRQLQDMQDAQIEAEYLHHLLKSKRPY